jgi:hypothetical protein
MIADTGPIGPAIVDEVGPRVRGGLGFREPVLRFHAVTGSVVGMEPEPTEAEKAKGERARGVLFLLMAIMVFTPLVIFLLQSR